MQLIVKASGTMHCLYDEELDLPRLGILAISPSGYVAPQRLSMNGRHGPLVWPWRDEMGGVTTHGAMESSSSSRFTIKRCRQSRSIIAFNSSASRSSSLSSLLNVLSTDFNLRI